MNTRLTSTSLKASRFFGEYNKKSNPIQLTIISVVLLFGLLSTGELLFWNNAKESYPEWLMKSAPENASNLKSLRQVCGQPLEIAPMNNGNSLVRCGTFWPARSIWMVPGKL